MAVISIGHERRIAKPTRLTFQHLVHTDGFVLVGKPESWVPFKDGNGLFEVVGTLRLADQDVADIVFVQDALDDRWGAGGIKTSHVRLPAVDLRLCDANAALLSLMPRPTDNHRKSGIHGGAGLDAVVGSVVLDGRQTGFGNDG